MTDTPVLCCCKPENLIGFFRANFPTPGPYRVFDRKGVEYEIAVKLYGNDEEGFITAVNSQERDVNFFNKFPPFRAATNREKEEWKKGGQATIGKWKRWRGGESSPEPSSTSSHGERF